jgi:hypothetical protein
MDSKLILAAARGTLDGSLSFPRGRRPTRRSWNIFMWITSGCANGFTTRRAKWWPRPSIMRTCRPSPRNWMPPRCARTSWTASAMARSIARSPGARWQAGVQGYIAFLRGKRVTCWGRTGDQHTEWFPGATGQTLRLVLFTSLYLPRPDLRAGCGGLPRWSTGSSGPNGRCAR